MIFMNTNLKKLMRDFNTEQKCRDFLVRQRWNGQPVCPHCGYIKVYTIDKGKGFKCASPKCYKKFTVTVGTVMQASNIPLTTWLPAIYLIASHKKGISSVQLAKDLGVTQKTGWFMLHRIREFMKENNPEMLSGIVESDETYMAKKFRSDYKGLSEEQIEALQKDNFSQKNKGAVLGLAERISGRIIVQAFDSNNRQNVQAAIKKNVKEDTMLFTDESNLYKSGLDKYNHMTVNHSRREWVRAGIIHTNNVEAFWSVMKRGVYGIYHQISFKHLQAYCNEFSYRYNSRKISDGLRFELSLKNIEGRLTYKQLVHGKGQENKEG
ncbi:MAG: IS1595 family transposase [Gammaproteobacteria bacterium]|nr:MAG: IS1595 family transposase [Gammaproteobacteria bacterium]